MLLRKWNEHFCCMYRHSRTAAVSNAAKFTAALAASWEGSRAQSAARRAAEARVFVEARAASPEETQRGAPRLTYQFWTPVWGSNFGMGSPVWGSNLFPVTTLRGSPVWASNLYRWRLVGEN